jgi:integrase
VTFALPSPADENPASAYLNGLARGGQRSQRSALRAIAIELGYRTPFEVAWASVTAGDVRRLRARFRTLYAGRTTNRMLSALRSVLGLAGVTGPEVERELHGSEPVNEQPAGRALTAGELGKLLAAARPTLSDARDVAMLAVMIGSGLRRDSIGKLDVGDWHADTGALLARKAKAGKTYEAVLRASLRPVLERFLELRGGDEGPLFPRLVNGKLTQARLSVSAVSAAIEALRARADVAPFATHDLRRTFASAMLDSGADLNAVARLMGHSNVATTAHYDRRKTSRLAELVDAMDRKESKP